MGFSRVDIPAGPADTFGDLSALLYANGQQACVVASHGLFGSKDDSFYREAGERLPNQGLDFLVFDYAGPREGGRLIETYPMRSKCEQLQRALEFAETELGYDQVGVLGASFGGYVARLISPEVLVTVSTPPSLVGALRRGSLRKGSQREGEYIVLDGDRVRWDVFRDAMQYDHEAQRAHCRHHLAIHGSADKIVPVRELRAFGMNGTTTAVVTGADHEFTTPAHRQQALDTGASWFRRHLLDGRT